jgi:uncharacterized membrane protein
MHRNQGVPAVCYRGRIAFLGALADWENIMRSIAGSIIILAGSIILAAAFHGSAVSTTTAARMQGPVPYLAGGALILVGFVVTANGFFEGDSRR